MSLGFVLFPIRVIDRAEHQAQRRSQQAAHERIRVAGQRKCFDSDRSAGSLALKNPESTIHNRQSTATPEANRSQEKPTAMQTAATLTKSLGAEWPHETTTGASPTNKPNQQQARRARKPTTSPLDASPWLPLRLPERLEGGVAAAWSAGDARPEEQSAEDGGRGPDAAWPTSEGAPVDSGGRWVAWPQQQANGKFSPTTPTSSTCVPRAALRLPARPRPRRGANSAR